MIKQAIVLMAVLMLNSGLLAQEHSEHATAPGAAAEKAGELHHDAGDPQPHPVISTDSSWAGPLIIIILGLFLAAAVIGPAVRANMPDEPAADHSHSAHDAHHGDAGHGHGH